MENIEYDVNDEMDYTKRGLSGWSNFKENAGKILEIGEGYAESQVENEKATAAYNNAVIMSMKQDTENKRVLIGQLSTGLLIIISAIVVVVIIKAWKR